MSAASIRQTNRRIRDGAAPAENAICFESFGVRGMIKSNAPEAVPVCLRMLDEALPRCHRLLPSASQAEHCFTIKWNRSGRDSLYKDGRPVALRTRRNTLLEMLVPRIRLTVAEFAPKHVFIHAGVVRWKDRAIVIPGSSMQGKTTLVLELVRRGAVYYSDEYAVIDTEGLIHPFPKTLSVRSEECGLRQTEVSAADFGGSTGIGPSKTSLVLISSFRAGKRWSPRRISTAQGVAELIRNSISIRRDPRFVLSLLERVASESLFLKSDRGEAAEIVDDVLAYAERILT